MTESSVGEFLEENSKLFTILGVFGAISVYFTQLELSSQWRRLGVVSSLSLFILISIAILRNMGTEKKQPFDFVIEIQRQKVGFLLFYVMFYSVVISVVAIVLQFSNTFNFLFQFICFIIGIGVARLWILRAYDAEPFSLFPGEDPNAVWILAKIFRNAIHAFATGGGLLSLAWVRGWIPIEQIIEFRIISLTDAVLIGLISGIFVGGVLWILLTGLAFVFYILLKKSREIGLYDEDWNLNEEILYSDQKKK